MLIGLTVLTDWARPGAATDIINAGAVEALTFVLATLALLRFYVPARPARAALGLRPTHPTLALLGVGLGLTLQVPAGSLYQLVEHFSPTPEALLRSQAALLSADTVPRLVAVLAVTACVAPLVEELFFRGAIFGTLCPSRPVVGAAGVSALCFVMVHGRWREWPALLVVSLALAHLRVASGSVLPCLALHVGFNTAAVVAIYSGFASVTRPVQFSWPVTVAGWLATAGLAYAAQQVAKRSTEAAQARAEDGQ
jgi:membrane protease YdiL (CAAX protease family)